MRGQIDPGAVVLTLNVSLSMSGEGVFPRTDQLGAPAYPVLSAHVHPRGPPSTTARRLSDVASMYISLVDETRGCDLG